MPLVFINVTSMTYYDSTTGSHASNESNLFANNVPDNPANSAPSMPVTSQPMNAYVVTNDTIENYLQMTGQSYSSFISALSTQDETLLTHDPQGQLTAISKPWTSIAPYSQWDLPLDPGTNMQPGTNKTGLESQQDIQAHVQLPKTLSLYTTDGKPLEVRLGSQAPQAVDGSELSDVDRRQLTEAFTVGKRGLAQLDTVKLPGEIEFHRIIYHVARDASVENVTEPGDLIITLFANSKNRVHSCLVRHRGVKLPTIARFIGQQANSSEKQQRVAEGKATSSPTTSISAPAATFWNGPDDFGSDEAVLLKFAEECWQAYCQTTRGQKALADGKYDVGDPYDVWVDTANAFYTWQATRSFTTGIDNSNTTVQGLRQLAKQGPQFWWQVVNAFQKDRQNLGETKNRTALNYLFKLMINGEMVTPAGMKNTRVLQLHPMHLASFDRYCQAREIPQNYRSESARDKAHAAARLLDEIRKREANSNGNPIALPAVNGTVYSRMDPHMLYWIDPQAFNDAAAAVSDAKDYVKWIRSGGL